MRIHCRIRYRICLSHIVRIHLVLKDMYGDENGILDDMLSLLCRVCIKEGRQVLHRLREAGHRQA
jgi:hypothetical protein